MATSASLTASTPSESCFRAAGDAVLKSFTASGGPAVAAAEELLNAAAETLLDAAAGV